MAESIISIVVEKLSDLLIQKAVFLGSVQDGVVWLRDELNSMRCFLKDADARQDEDEQIKRWVSDIRNAAYEAEDIIDTFILKIESQKKKGIVQRYSCIFKELTDLNKVGKEIESLKVKLGDISRRRDTYGFTSAGEGTSSTTRERLRDVRRSSHLGSEKDIVGLQKDTAQLVEQLLKKEDRFVVISIAECRPKDIMQTIIREVLTNPTPEQHQMIEHSQQEDLVKMVYEHLQEKCYLVVLDDTWTTEAWDVLERAFPKTNNGSKLLLTTRNKDVARHVALRTDARSILHELKLLGKEDSWELFSRKAFVDEVDNSCPPELKKVATEMVKKCAGLPLAIVVIGGLLSVSGKKLEAEWRNVLNNIDSYFARDQNRVLPILALSYIDLPYYLKSCFLYLGHFPEDYVISTQRLFQLWIAEGLIPQGEKRMESTAEDYLNELVDRNMVQVVRTSTNNRIKECQIHDLLRDLSISKAKDEIFLEIQGKIDFAPSVKCRHQAIYSNYDSYFHSKPSTPHLRSLMLFNSDGSTSLQLNICASFKLLRVLDLENIEVDRLPSKIGQLINLRYLSLRAGEIQLPSSMRYLRSLQTLWIYGNVDLRKAPNVIYKMENLQHLHMSWAKCDGRLRIDTLRHLQTLSRVHVDIWKHNKAENLRSLRKLGVEVERTSDLNNIFHSMVKLQQLSALDLSTSPLSENNIPSLKGLSLLHSLTKLHLSERLMALPEAHEFPPNLTKLTLYKSRLNHCPMVILKDLPKLSILRLRYMSYMGEQLEISATGFPQLQFLELKNLDNLEQLIIENGAVPRLKHFRIFRCAKLTKLHSDWVGRTALPELEITYTPLKLNKVPSSVGVSEGSSSGVGDQ